MWLACSIHAWLNSLRENGKEKQKEIVREGWKGRTEVSRDRDGEGGRGFRVAGGWVGGWGKEAERAIEKSKFRCVRERVRSCVPCACLSSCAGTAADGRKESAGKRATCHMTYGRPLSDFGAASSFCFVCFLFFCGRSCDSSFSFFAVVYSTSTVVSREREGHCYVLRENGQGGDGFFFLVGVRSVLASLLPTALHTRVEPLFCFVCFVLVIYYSRYISSYSEHDAYKKRIIVGVRANATTVGDINV